MSNAATLSGVSGTDIGSGTFEVGAHPERATRRTRKTRMVRILTVKASVLDMAAQHSLAT